MKPGSSVAWLSAEHAAEYLDFTYRADVVRNGVVVHRAGAPNVHAFHQFLYSERRAVTRRLRVSWLRGRMRFRRADLDALLEQESTSASGGDSNALRLVRTSR
jgi:hypothetical protein